MNAQHYKWIGLAAMLSTPAVAIDLADIPLFLTTPLAPNLFVTLDTSGSMQAAHTPDSSASLDATKRYKSSDFNPMYYNPAVKYDLPRKFDGTYATTSFTAAYINGYDTSKGSVNLETNYKATKNYAMTSSSQTDAGGTNPFASAGVNHVHTGTMSGVNSGSNAPFFTITDFVNADGSASGWDPGSNLVSVTVDGTARSWDGTYNGICNNSVESGSTQFETYISGSNLTLCFNDSNTNYGKTVVLTHKLGASSSPAYYYRHYSSAGVALPAGCDGTKTDDDCYIAVKVDGSSGLAVQDLNGDGVINISDADERQNFANWYSFYRVRTLAMVTAADIAFWDVPSTTRIAWQNLNTCTSFAATGCSGRSGSVYPSYLKEFSGTHRDNFFKWLFDIKTASGTPLRMAAQRVGEYVKQVPTSGANDVFAEFPQSSIGTRYSCRKNFHILMTDGEWNSSGSPGETGIRSYGNLDGSLADPYSDSVSGSLADVIYDYWANDLRSDLANNVPKSYAVDANETVTSGATSVVLARDNNPKNNPADWQHVVTFTMGLGLSETLKDPVWAGSTYAGGYARLVTNQDQWTDSSSSTTRKIYDLWHGAINSRGQFFSTEDPNEMRVAFAAILNAIDADVSSASGLSTNSASIQTDSVVFQGRFRPRDWSGELLAYPIASGGTLGSPTWNASAKMSSRNANKIMTWVPGVGGQPFSWSNLNVDQKALLNKNIAGTPDTLGDERVDWLKGSSALEVRNGGAFRNRTTSVLGDIVNSDLVYSAAEDLRYGSAPFTAAASEGASYAAFVTAKASRPSMVYAGANDGMLHGFTAHPTTGGDELFAYVPNVVYGKLSALTDPGYAHQYYVDGPASVGDAYIGGSWKTILASSLGKGGKAVFALDVSDPSGFNASHVLWEKSDQDTGFTNLGYVYGKPRTVRISSGWVTIFGNGYNSSTGKASLFVLNAASGTVLAEIVVDNGPSNGLSEPTLVDANGDNIVDYAYAGDLAGNMWKFDLASLNSPYKLFAASAAGVVQPITAPPTWGASPDSVTGGRMIYFGTGQYLGETDKTNNDVQTMYGIWDKGAPVSRAELQAQSITSEVLRSGRTVRSTSDATVDWTGSPAELGWYMDLTLAGSPSGERIARQPRLALGWLHFTTLIPNEDRCESGGNSWYYLLNPLTGARPSVSAVDLNKDGVFNSDDEMPDGTAPSAAKSEIGILSSPLVISHSTSSSWDAFSEMLGGTGDAGGASGAMGSSYTSGSSGIVGTELIREAGGSPLTPPSPGVSRVYWRQIQ